MSSLFQKTVWSLLATIPKGRVSTYGGIALALKKPGAARAVGNACNANPFAPRIPCHRVVASDGRLGGFALGIRKKTELLEKEGIRVKNGKILDFKRKLWRFAGEQ